MAEEKLTNIVTSTKPCPICAQINGMTMTLAEWEASPYGVPGSDGRYCNGACHCVLIPDGLLGSFDWIDPNYIPRGDAGSSIRPIVEIFPNEKGLADLMNDWNLYFGKLPPEIYAMGVKDGYAYLMTEFLKRTGGVPPGGGFVPPKPAPPPPIPPPPPPAPTPIPAPAPKPAPKRGRAAKGKVSAADIQAAKKKASFKGESDQYIAAQIATERRLWSLNESAKARKGRFFGHGREFGSALDANGNEIFFKGGGQSRIEYKWPEIQQIIKAKTFLHNHPGYYANSFSGADMNFAVYCNMERMVVPSVGKRYVVIRKGAEWYPGWANDMAKAQAAYLKGDFGDMNKAMKGIEKAGADLQAGFEKIWAKKKPDYNTLQAAADAAGAPFEQIKQDAWNRWDKLMKDPAASLEDSRAARAAYLKAGEALDAARQMGKESVLCVKIDEAFAEFAKDFNLKYHVEDWD